MSSSKSESYFTVKKCLPFCCLWINFTCFAYMRSSGIFYMQFIKEFNCTYGQASLTFVLMGSCASFMIGITSFLTRYFQIKNLVICGILICALSNLFSSFSPVINWIIVFGAINGIGIGMFGGLLPIIISQYYNEERSKACGISYAGSTLSSLFFPSLIQLILDYFSLQTALIFISAITFSGIFSALFLKSPKPISNNNLTLDYLPVNTICNEETKINVLNSEFDGKLKQLHIIKQLKHDFHILTNLKFWLVTNIYTVYIFTFISFIIIKQDFAVDRGLDELKAASLTSFYSIGDLIGRLLPGVLHTRKIISNQVSYLFSMLFMSVTFIAFYIYAYSYWTFAILNFIMGIMNGVQMTLPVVVMSELIGTELATIGYGFCNIISGILALARSYVIDVVKHNTGSYDDIFKIFSGLCFLITLPWILKIGVVKMKVILEKN